MTKQIKTQSSQGGKLILERENHSDSLNEEVEDKEEVRERE
jgi:hypothetical protein